MKRLPEEASQPAALPWALIVFVFGFIMISAAWGILDGAGQGPFWAVIGAAEEQTTSTEAQKGINRIKLMWRFLLIAATLAMAAWGLNRANLESDIGGR